MRSLSVTFTAMILTIFVVSVNAQGHAAHHPDQSTTAQTDSGSGMGMHGMMQGGMMSQQGMHAQNGKMSMMGGCGMMDGKGMQGGMMGNMMNMMHGQGMMGHHNAMNIYFHLINHLPNMKTQLELSDAQLTQLKTIQSDFFKRKADWEADIEKKQIDLNLMLDKKASAADVRKTLKSIYDVKLDMQAASYEIGQKMKAVLSADQQEKLDDSLSMCMGQGMMGMMGGQM